MSSPGLVSLCILLLVAIASIFGKYVYIQKRMSWADAQKYCQNYHTELATVSNQEDINFAQQIIGTAGESVWIGLQRNSTDNMKWAWSGGGAVTGKFWGQNQPDYLTQKYAVIRNSFWYDEYETDLYTFLCSSVKVVRQPMQWEDAIDYCKKNYREMASVTSQEEMMLIQKELRKGVFTEYVWIGLHFLSGQWMWVNRRQVVYESWGVKGKPKCPMEGVQCAALSTQELKSSMASSYGTNTQEQYIKEWNACDCTKLLHFICY